MTDTTDCEEIRTLLYAKHRHETTEEEAVAVEKHLRACPTCWSANVEMEKNLLLLGSANAPDPSARVWQNIRAAVSDAAPVDMRELRSPTTRRASWPWSRLLAGLALAAAAVFLISFARDLIDKPSPIRAELLRVEGALEVREHKQAPWLAIRDKVSVGPGHSIRCGAGSGALLRLPDSTGLNLHADTEITWLDAEHFFLVRGGVFADVAPRKSGFTIDTEHGVNEVRGTRFFVLTSPTETVLTVHEGLVRLYNDKGGVEVPPSHQALASRGYKPNPPVRVDLSAIVGGRPAGNAHFDLRFELLAPPDTLFKRKDQIKCRLTLTNATPALVKLRAFSVSGSSYFILQAYDPENPSVRPTVALSGNGVEQDFSPETNSQGGIITLYRHSWYSLSFDASPHLQELLSAGFSGKIRLKMTYQVYGNDSKDIWTGKIETPEIEVNYRR